MCAKYIFMIWALNACSGFDTEWRYYMQYRVVTDPPKTKLNCNDRILYHYAQCLWFSDWKTSGFRPRLWSLVHSLVHTHTDSTTADLPAIDDISRKTQMRWKLRFNVIDQTYKSQNAPVPYPTMLHSEQICAHFCSEWSIVRYGTDAFWDLWIRSIEFLIIRSQQNCADATITVLWCAFL